MTTVIMPKMGDAMEEGTLLKWLKAEGDAVARDEPIAEIETDKATLELTAEYEGTLSKRIAGEGQSVPIGQPIAIILRQGEKADESANGAAAPPQAAAPKGNAPKGAGQEARGPAQPAQAPPDRGEGGETSHGATIAEKPAADSGTDGAAAPASPAPASAEGRIKASPLARRIAEEHGIDLRGVRGSGPGGRIVREDVEAARSAPRATEAPAAAAPAPAPAAEAAPAPEAAPAEAPPPAAPAPGAGDRQVPLSRMRSAIARQMVVSKTTIPHFYVSVDVDMTEALAWRKRLNEAAAGEGYKITVNDMIVKASGLALTKFPNLNASFGGDHMTMHDRVDISIAVALKEGLIAPVVRGVDKKSLGTVAREANDLVGRARDGKLTPAEYSGGTFTVSNLGPFGVETFIAIVTAPQVAALAVGSSAQKAVVVNGEIVIRDRMIVTLSADHRVTDGAEGAQFIGEVRRLLENPLALLM